MPKRIYCHWRRFTEKGYNYWTTDSFNKQDCVLISPRFARFQYDEKFLPYFQVNSGLRRHIWQSLTGLAVPQNAVIRHQCLMVNGIDSRGLCVNPTHIMLGSTDDNRSDARIEEIQRAQLGYWKPPHAQALSTLPVQVQMLPDLFPSSFHDPNVLYCWSGTPQPLDAKDVTAENYCNLFARTFQPTMPEPDLCAIRLARQLLEAMKDNNDTKVCELINVFQTLKWRKHYDAFGNKCNAHFSKHKNDDLET
jgi:hypothetical protein